MAPRLRTQVIAFTAARLVFNTAFRMVTPLLPAFRDGLGVSLKQLAVPLTWRSLAGALGPFLASIADTRGRKVGMLVGLFLFSSGISIVIFWPTFLGFTIALVVSTLGKFVFDPAMQAYLGDRVPFERRGFVLAMAELGWSGASLLGVPLMAMLIAKAGWLAPFPLLALLGVAAMLTIYKLMPHDKPDASEYSNLFRNFGIVFSSASAWAGLSVVFLLSLSNEIVNLIVGVWLEDAFALQIASLGAVAIVIGLAELSGEGLVSGLVDRLGKRRSITIGLVGNSLAALALPVLSSSLPGAIIGLFIFYISFEFTFVSALPLMTELLPKTRATYMALIFASASIGRAAADAIGIQIFVLGFAVSAGAAALINAGALLALRGVRVAADETS
ncbi:MAG: MFS transporter [Chloroflexota bacterium]